MTKTKAPIEPTSAQAAVKQMVKNTKGAKKKEWKRLDTLIEEKQKTAE